MDFDSKKNLWKMVSSLKRKGFTVLRAEESRECLPISYKYSKKQKYLVWEPGKYFIEEGFYPKKSFGGTKNEMFKVAEKEGTLPKGFRWVDKMRGSVRAD